MKDAQKAGLRGHVATNVAIDTPVGKLKDATQLSETDLRFYMKRFGEADTTKTGMLRLADFEKAPYARCHYSPSHWHDPIE